MFLSIRGKLPMNFGNSSRVGIFGAVGFVCARRFRFSCQDRTWFDMCCVRFWRRISELLDVYSFVDASTHKNGKWSRVVFHLGKDINLW